VGYPSDTFPARLLGADAVDGRIALPKGVVLDGSYRVERVVASGGFGITYEAEDTRLGTRVAIKEYYPAELSERDATMGVRARSEEHQTTFAWGRKSFLQEARILARFRHPSIVRVARVFEALSTAYMVMDFEEGQPLEQWLRSLGRAPTQQELDRIADPILDALEIMHAQSFIHRDIAPDNIIIRADGVPVLLDFGAARRAVAETSRMLTGIVKAGYSPQEQYATDSRFQGPWTDLYALGATLYRAVSGRPPTEATLRALGVKIPKMSDEAADRYRFGFLAAIDACLALAPADRPRSVAQLRVMLFTTDTSASTPLPEAETRRIPSLQSSLRTEANSLAPHRWIISAAMVLLMLLGTIGGLHHARSTADNANVKIGQAAWVATNTKMSIGSPAANNDEKPDFLLTDLLDEIFRATTSPSHRRASASFSLSLK
jgi:serine/threonine protein kinase